MNCRDFREMIDSYLSDELLTETNHDVLRHMEDCASCRSVIEARREVRSRLKSAVINSPQYQIGKNFTHNLQTQLKHEALQNQQTNSGSWLGFGSWAVVAAGLILVFTFGFILFNTQGIFNSSEVAESNYSTSELPQNHLVNIAFGDHEYCAIQRGAKQNVKLAKTPAKYADMKEVAMPELKTVLADYKLKESHTCKYKDTKFTHLIITKDNETVSLMLTDKEKAEKFSNQISTFSSNKYELARFDVENTAVFVVSGLDKQTNSQVANALYNPLRKHLKRENGLQTSLLMFY